MPAARLVAALVVALATLGLATTAQAREICANQGLATSGTAALALFPTGTGAIETLTATGARFGQPAISADSATAYVPDAAGDRLLVVATGPFSVTASIALPAGAGPTSVVLSPTRSRAYVLNAAARTIALVDTANRVALGTTAALADPLVDIAIAPDGRTLYALTSGGGQVQVHPLAATADATTPGSPLAVTASAAYALAVLPGSQRLAIANLDGATHRLSVLDADGTDQVDGADLGGQPTALALSASGATAYVATAQPTLRTVPITTLAPGATATPSGPVGALAVGPTGTVYAAEATAIGTYSAAGTRTGAVADAAGTAVALCPSTATLAGAPTAVNGARADGAITVAWTPPASDGGARITAYEVTATPGGGTCTATGATSCTVTGLTNGTRYAFTVRARNALGLGPQSAASRRITPRRDTGARELVATAVTARAQRNRVIFSVTATVDRAGTLSMAVLVRKRLYCATSRRVSRPGAYRLQCRMTGAGRELVRTRRTEFTVRTVLMPQLGTVARSTQTIRVPRRR